MAFEGLVSWFEAACVMFARPAHSIKPIATGLSGNAAVRQLNHLMHPVILCTYVCLTAFAFATLVFSAGRWQQGVCLRGGGRGPSCSSPPSSSRQAAHTLFSD